MYFTIGSYVGIIVYIIGFLFLFFKKFRNYISEEFKDTTVGEILNKEFLNDLIYRDYNSFTERLDDIVIFTIGIIFYLLILLTIACASVFIYPIVLIILFFHLTFYIIKTIKNKKQ